MQNKTVDARSNEKTREISITAFEKDSVQPFLPIKVRRSNVRREMRRIKRTSKKSRSPLEIMLSLGFCLCVCTCLSYLAFSGIYAPKEICSAVVNMCKSVYTPQKSNAEFSLVDGNAASFSQKPQYLTEALFENPSLLSPGTSSLGETIHQSTDKQQSSAIQNDITVSNEVPSGKTGVDGQIFYPLISKDLSESDPTLLINQTSYTPNTKALLSQTPSAFENLTISEKPLVLILHTHATECYSQSTSDASTYLSTEPTRLDDTNQNVVRVGKELSETLNSFGIKAVHATALHDKASFINAYTESKKTAEKYLKEYPSIRFVIDLHRDAITNGNQKTKAATKYGNQSYAQLMFVVGTNEAGHNHPDWQSNLSLALNLQNASNEMYPHLFRKTNLRNVPFNQQLSNGYLLLEVGTNANNLDEALRSINAFGTVFAGEILKHAN